MLQENSINLLRTTLALHYSMNVKLNQKQLAGLLVSSFLIICIVIAHYPFDGYRTSYTSNPTSYGPPCPPMASSEEINRMLGDELNAYVETHTSCGRRIQTVVHQLSFNQWTSKGALLPSVSSPRIALSLIALICIACAMWLFYFRHRKA